ncbi:CPBP family intramembrane glutamic endopeptidase [Negativibacillus massiliensis]|uniref:CPBP family intramembrane glutamic endopeptidase n=1 Tax=Negativibacillus massiliensis TaxID=1871035 RepID=UPI003AF96C01
MIKKMNLFFLILLVFLMPLTMLCSIFLIEALGSYIISVSFLYEICLFILMYTFLKMNRLSFAEVISIRKTTRKNLLLSVCAGLLVTALGLLWVRLCLKLDLFSGQANEPGMDIYTTVFATVFLAPVIEELLFRGVLWSILQENKGTATAVIVTTVYFVFLHLTLNNAFSAILIGICGSMFILFTGSIIPSIVIHLLNNLLVTILGYSDIMHLQIEKLDSILTISSLLILLVIFAILLALVMFYGFFVNKEVVMKNVKTYQPIPKVIDRYSIAILCFWMIYMIVVG